jgi:hypothetical protein
MNNLRPLTLRPNRLKFFALAMGSLIFLLIGIWMIVDGEWKGWFVTIFALVCLAVFIVAMLPGATYLALDDVGFTVCSLHRVRRYRWIDVGEFVAVKLTHNKMVMFNFSPSFAHLSTIRKVNASFSGFEAGLPDNYGLSHEKLAVLMNAYATAFRPSI